MQRSTLRLVLAALALAGACSEQPMATDPSPVNSEASFAKGRGGGNGSPHFTDDGTSCTFGTYTGRLACTYQIAGLASSSSGLGSLVANMVQSWDCFYSDATRDYSRVARRVAIDFYYYADESGNAKGSAEGTASGSASCQTKYIAGSYEKPEPSNVMYWLDELSSPFTLPVIGSAGSWALSATVSTPKKGLQYIFYLGRWMPEEPV